MDNLSDTFGSLSTNAPEWKPPGSETPTPKPAAKASSTGSDWSSDASDLNAVAVKEFIPGKGWITAPAKLPVDSQQPAGPRPTGQGGYADAAHAGRAENGGYVDQTSHGAAEGFPGMEATIEAGPTPAPPPFRSLHGLGLSDDLWRYYRAQTFDGLRQMDPKDPRHKAVPAPYCNAFCLDDLTVSANGRARSRSFGYPSTTFQVTSREDGYVYCLRRFDNVKSATPSVCASVLDRWSKLGDHPNLVQLHRCFIAQRALFFVYSYVPGAISIKERWNGPISEEFLWSAISQFASVLRRVHRSGSAVRTMDTSHVLTTTDPSQSHLRVHINCAGIVDVIECETQKSLIDLQHQDIRNFGRLVLSIATGTDITPQTDGATISRCEQYCINHYSRELHNLCFTLIRSRIPPSMGDVCRVLADRLLDEMDASNMVTDKNEAALAAEYESSRALRLLLKMGFVNERPEFGPNRRWAQSGDCYILGLFRDYVFHQADGAGQPVMDLGHVITALNKLDAADEEKIVLSSRDGKTLMVVTFADVARCLDSAYHELCSGSVPPPTLHY